jgi:hypothetical protein
LIQGARCRSRIGSKRLSNFFRLAILSRQRLRRMSPSTANFASSTYGMLCHPKRSRPRLILWHRVTRHGAATAPSSSETLARFLSCKSHSLFRASSLLPTILHTFNEVFLQKKIQGERKSELWNKKNVQPKISRRRRITGSTSYCDVLKA